MSRLIFRELGSHSFSTKFKGNSIRGGTTKIQVENIFIVLHSSKKHFIDCLFSIVNNNLI